MHWLGIGRNAVLVMPAAATIADNKIDKIHYDDADELLYNDMELLSRIWDKQRGTQMGRRGVMNNLSDHLIKLLKKSHDRTISQIGDMLYGGYVDLGSNVPEINDPNDLANFVRNSVLEKANEYRRPEIEKLPVAWWKRLVSDAVEAGVKTYSSEGEWVVADNSLKIPKGSRLLVAVTKRPEDFPEEVRAALKNGELIGFPGITQSHIASGNVIKSIYAYGLDKKYDVRFIDLKKFEEIQLKLQTKHFYGK